MTYLATHMLKLTAQHANRIKWETRETERRIYARSKDEDRNSVCRNDVVRERPVVELSYSRDSPDPGRQAEPVGPGAPLIEWQAGSFRSLGGGSSGARCIGANGGRLERFRRSGRRSTHVL